MVMHRDSGLVLDTRNLGLLHDYSRNHHTLTNHGATPVRGKFGKGMLFDGVNDYIDCGNDASLNITDAITIEAWVKSEGIAWAAIAGKLEGSGSKKEWGLYVSATKFMSRFDTNIGSNVIEADSIYTLGVWNHVAGGRTVAGVSYLYINGIQQAETGTLLGDINPTINCCIGAGIGGTAYYFNGSIFSIKIYNRTLSAYEIAQHYQAYGNYGALCSAPKIL